VPFGHAIYHNRNRIYIPTYGRFSQRDPNQTAMQLIAGSHSGRGVGAVSLAFSFEGWYGDGHNLYQYLGSNPLLRYDPLGLSWDPFDMVDDYLAETAGQKAAFLGKIIGGAVASTYYASTILSALPFPAAFLIGELGLALVDNADMILHPSYTSTIQAAIEFGGSPAERAFGKLLGQSQEAYYDAQADYQPGGHTGEVATASFSEMLRAGPAIWILYEAKNALGEVVYYGVTTDLQQRRRDHGPRFARVDVIRGGLSNCQARALETYSIERGRSMGLKLENKIRSISPRRAFFQFMMDWAKSQL
jgi:predicted GIY-YIG superfamily endonuclease